MIKNYIKIAWRNLLKNKGYSALNIGGLAVGMAVALLIGMWIYDELSFNKYHKNYDRIANVMVKINFGGQGYAGDPIPRPLEFEMRNKYGKYFKNIVMSRWNESHILAIGDKRISQNGRFMQQDAPEMLTLDMVKGTRSGLKDLHSIMLSASTAKALFGDENPVDKTLRMDNKMDVKVTGVYKDVPENSSFKDLQFLSTWDLMIANNEWMQENKDKWGNSSYLMYVQLQPNTTFESVSAIIKNAKQDNVGPEEKKFNFKIFLNPMSRWHLFGEWKDGINTGGRIQYVWMFGIICGFVLLLACINFMNLSTAHSEKRAKEVGVRKAIGSMRGQLIRQFLSESVLIVSIAFVVAIVLVATALPWFNNLSDKNMGMFWSNGYFWLISLAFIAFTSLVSGSYPAFYLSSFNPVDVLKGTLRAGRFAGLPRKVLVVVQFTVSVALIIGTIIVSRQIKYAKARPVGYTREGLLSVQIKSPDLLNKYDVLVSQLKSEGVATSVSRASSPTTGVWSNNGGLKWPGKDPNKADDFGTVWITHDYGKTVGWQFKEGRDYSTAFAADSVSKGSDSKIVHSMIVNEAAVKYMDLKNPLGEIVDWGGYPFRIVGVIKDMVMESPFDPVRQTMFLVNTDNAVSYIQIRINPQLNTGEALAKIETTFKKLVPAVPFEYKFVDTAYAEKFAAEERIGSIASVFATLAILISCLGLFGLASFIAEKRTKEIGIRKVLGASIFNLWKMLSTEFVVLVIVAGIIATPLAYYFLNNWLQNYEYRTAISWWVFAIAIGGALLITVLTVSFQTIKAALTNPVKSLRSE